MSCGSCGCGSAGGKKAEFPVDRAFHRPEDAAAADLDLKARVPGATQEQFDTAVNAAKTGCPVSKLYKANITLTSKLEG